MTNIARGILGVLAVAFVLAVALSPSEPRVDPRTLVRKLSVDGGNGSGVVLRPGVVLTARHVASHDGLVVKDKGTQGVRLALSAGDVDLGLLYFPSAEAKCPCVKLADSEAQVDETVYVVGFPLGIANVVSVGKAQGINDHVTVPGMFGEAEELGRRLVMTALAVPGNSGGGVFVKRDGEFQLVGILVEGGPALSLAIPLSDVRKFLAERA